MTDDNQKVVRLPIREKPAKDALSPSLDGVYEILSAALTQLRTRGIRDLTASLDGYVVTLRQIEEKDSG